MQGFRFPPVVWSPLSAGICFGLSYSDAEELITERGTALSSMATTGPGDPRQAEGALRALDLGPHPR
jgi:hypothetical protein